MPLHVPPDPRRSASHVVVPDALFCRLRGRPWVPCAMCHELPCPTPDPCARVVHGQGLGLGGGCMGCARVVHGQGLGLGGGVWVVHGLCKGKGWAGGGGMGCARVVHGQGLGRGGGGGVWVVHRLCMGKGWAGGGGVWVVHGLCMGKGWAWGGGGYGLCMGEWAFAGEGVLPVCIGQARVQRGHERRNLRHHPPLRGQHEMGHVIVAESFEE